MPFKYGLKEDDFAVAPKPRAIDDPDSVLTANDRSRDGEMPLSVQQTELMHRQTIALESIAASLNRLRLYELPVKTK